MGIPPQPFHGNEEKLNSNSSLWAWRRLRSRKVRHFRRRPRSVVMKRRASLECSRRPPMNNTIEKKLKTLKKLIPNKESMGLDGLFSDTADYILALQMRVKVMQIMVEVLTGSDDE